jgi:hypothetical protein
VTPNRTSAPDRIPISNKQNVDDEYDPLTCPEPNQIREHYNIPRMRNPQVMIISRPMRTSAISCDEIGYENLDEWENSDELNDFLIGSQRNRTFGCSPEDNFRETRRLSVLDDSCLPIKFEPMRLSNLQTFSLRTESLFEGSRSFNFESGC